ncbi:MAG: serine protease [Pseudomonadota bacterium]
MAQFPEDRSVARFHFLTIMGLLLAACAQPAPVADTTDQKRAVLSHALATTVQVFSEREGGVRRAGSAVILQAGDQDRPAIILTTAHTFEPLENQSLSVTLEPHAIRAPAQLLAIDSEKDLALLSAELVARDQVQIAPGAQLADEVLVVAFPWGRSRTVVNGAVSQIKQEEILKDLPPIWGAVNLIDASVSYGMSGGGIFDKSNGQLVGLVRGYRTAQLSLSSEKAPLKLPIAGETTVVSTRDIGCFLVAAQGDPQAAEYISAGPNPYSC